ncbi:AMIN-like domain-containing (lipo)protein [Yaniella halotolerans]|uniref:AMIN-like domain-containing (lipo)protein n=1 Tax=Yaniella halotolerans TaxID=225453 RepID=UPI0003B700E9|nr:hypothetical protein [Yaniella halotolerans]
MNTSSPTRNTRLSLATVLVAGLFIAGCGQDDEVADEERPPPPPAGEEVTLGPEDDIEDETEPDEDASGEVSTEPVGEFSTELYESEDWPAFGETYGIYPTEVRSAVFDGFERIVIQHSGSGAPSYMAQYTDEPVEPGRGQPVDTGDAAYLEVIVSGTTPPEMLDDDDLRNTDDTEMLEHGTQITDLETEATGTVVSFAPWEATSNYIIGLDEQRPYAITLLEDPVRIVIDIQLDDQE